MVLEAAVDLNMGDLEPDLSMLPKIKSNGTSWTSLHDSITV